jgi:mRNA interferase RelE/StbE
MIFEFLYTRRAVRDIEGLAPKIGERIGKTLLRFKEDPLKYADKITDSALGTYRFRIGDYRVIFDIEGDDLVVLRVGHRREIYKRG